MAYLGDIAPGQTVTARYTISADSKAAPAIYNLDTNVQYRDSMDNTLTSDTTNAPVEVVSSAPGGLQPVLAILSLIALVLLGAGYYLVAMRRKR
jgi:hypothetical protein